VINQMVLSTYLKKLGYTYSACANGREAVDCFVAEQIDAVIMDMEMPVRALHPLNLRGPGLTFTIDPGWTRGDPTNPRARGEAGRRAARVHYRALG
jgi:CheY-like chemotaxis protein